MIILCVGATLASIVAWRERDIAYVLVFVWAFAGIAAKQAGEPAVVRTAFGAIPVMLAVLGWRWVTASR